MSGFLVLWDVDYTLVDATGVGWQLYQLAFADLFGVELPAQAREADMAGRTDRAIVPDVLALAGVPDPDGHFSAFAAAVARHAPGAGELTLRTARALPGAAAALAALSQIGARQSLLTGNIRALAEAKLAPLGLTTYLDLDVGAYGDEHKVRAELVHLARQRAAAAYGADFAGQATVLIGDTPLDVEAALTTGARAVGVATGRFSQAELTAAGADAVLADLTSTADVLTAVLGEAYQPRPA